MTTIVVVRKGDEIAIAAESLTTFGDTRLAAVLKGFAAQVNEWRQTVLKGQLDDQWFTDGLEPPTIGASTNAHV